MSSVACAACILERFDKGEKMRMQVSFSFFSELFNLREAVKGELSCRHCVHCASGRCMNRYVDKDSEHWLFSLDKRCDLFSPANRIDGE